MNKVLLMGRMTNKEVKEVGKKEKHLVASFGMAIDKFASGEKQTDFFNVTAWDKKADFIDKYVEIGKRILVVGFLTNEKYTDKEGNEKTIQKIIATDIEYADKFDKKEEKTEREELPY